MAEQWLRKGSNGFHWTRLLYKCEKQCGGGLVRATYPNGCIPAGPCPASVVGRPAEVEVGEIHKGQAHASCGSNADAVVGAILDPDAS